MIITVKWRCYNDIGSYDGQGLEQTEYVVKEFSEKVHHIFSVNMLEEFLTGEKL